MTKARGLFVTFEGIEGSGKTTQLDKIADFLESQGRSVVRTKEPGGTPVGLKLREMILNPETQFSGSTTEVLLFFADRIEHVQTVVVPALERGDIVLCDRYFDSTEAYQIGGRGMERAFIDRLQEEVRLMPDLTLLLDITPEEGLRRAKARAALDRFEKEAMDFHHRVRDTYGKIAKREPDRVKSIGVSDMSIERVYEAVLPVVKAKLESEGGDL